MPEQFPLPYASLDLTGQVALVTGGSAGIGRRFVQTLAAAGASVVATARRVDKLQEVVAEVTDAGGKAVAVPMDLLDADSILRAVDDAEQAFGLITILVNNAGIPDAQWAVKMSVELIDRVLDTNIRGPYILACEIARRLIAAGSPGRIVNLSSGGAFNYTSTSASALYSITKAAQARMAEVLAVEWARYNINVNAIAPGAFNSEMMDGMIQRVGEFAHHFPRKRMGEPAQLDSTLLYLCSPASECVTGTVIRVDDGQSAR